MSQSPRALTLKSNGGKLRVINTNVFIIPTGFIERKGMGAQAIWDTGATGSVITTRIVKELGLIPSGRQLMNTANGTIESNTYTIDIGLQSGVVIQGIIASEVERLSGGSEVLIGMDVITMGDFSITNHNGTTCVSFRVPSLHEIDYVKNPTYGVTPIVKNAVMGSNYTPPKKKRKK